MKLKDILLEANEVEEFKKLIQREKLIGTEGNLYRGVTAGSRVRTQTFAEVKVRRDRRPRNSSLELDAYIEGVRKRWFPDRPSRRSSAFITPHYDTARIYGKVYNVMIPKKANIWMTPVDPYLEYFNTDIVIIFMDLKKIIAAFRKIKELAKGTSLHGELEDMEIAIDLVDAMFENDWNEVERLASKGHSYILSETERWIKSLRSLPADLPDSARNIFETSEGYRIANVLRELRSLARGVERYYESLIPYNPSQADRMEEILVDTGYYYIVDYQWFNENFA